MGLVGYLLALLTGCSGVFFYPDQQTYVTPDRLGLDYRNVYLETKDGETLHGWWLPAKGPATGTVYYLHGNAQNVSSHVLNVAWLPDEGYQVFLIDYRGYGQSTGSPDIQGAMHDVETGLRWLVHQPEAQDAPVFLLGQSLGGALAVNLVSHWQTQEKNSLLHGLILDGTFSGFREIAREKLGSFWLTWPLQVPLSWTIPGELEATDHIQRVSPTPLLLIHSTQDAVIPFHHGERLYDAAREPKDFLVTDTPHAATFMLPEYRVALLRFMATLSPKGDERAKTENP